VTDPLTVQQQDALWDAIAVPGQKEPRFVEQHERVCRTVAELLDDATCGPRAVLAEMRALRDDLRGTTGARWIADALDRILGDQPTPDTTTPDAYRAAIARIESSGPRPTPAQAVRHVHVTITNPDEYTANRAALSLTDWINAEFPGHTVTTDAREWPATTATQATECSASISGHCLRESQSETACDTEASECVHGGQPSTKPDDTEPDTCRPVDIDGQLIRVRGAGEMSDESRAALADVIRAAKRKYGAEHQEQEQPGA
jgi:hypothetical protein